MARMTEVGTVHRWPGLFQVLSLGLLGLLLGFFPARAADTGHHFGVVIVSDLSNPAMASEERKASQVVVALRKKLGIEREQLPIMVYHFNNPQERTFCEQKLGIREQDLVLVGVAEYEDQNVTHILRRVVQVNHPRQAATQMFSAIAELLGIQVGDLHLPTLSEPPSQQGHIQFDRLEIYKQNGQDADHFSAYDDGVFFSVMIKNLTPDHDHAHTLYLDVYDPKGRLYGRPLGGRLQIKSGSPWSGRDALSEADPNGVVGFRIAGEGMADMPGTWTAAVELDGRTVDQQQFAIEAAQLKLDRAFLTDDKGLPCTRFNISDTGVYLFLYFENLAPTVEQQHQLKIQVMDPQGNEYPVDMGGSFKVQVGEDLSHKAFPADLNPDISNGLLIREGGLKREPGVWKYVVRLDGLKVRELPFTIESATSP
ncbi:MAG: hypothetical protein ACYCW6_11320 [Candidatus Xenobia bacterium]